MARDLANRLAHTDPKSFSAADAAGALKTLQQASNAEGIRKLRDSYLVSLARSSGEGYESLRQRVDEDLLHSASLADLAGGASGYDEAAPKFYKTSFDGPVAQFYILATGYRPGKPV